MRFFLILSLIIAATSASASPGDPLFSKMVGRWTAEGRRNFMISGRAILLSAEVFSTIQDDRLISENVWSEVPAEAQNQPPFRYKRIYWIQPTEQPGEYALGYGSQSGQPASHGYLGGTPEQFSVKQRAGELMIESITLFSEGESIYFETTWNGETKISEATVRYKRLDP